METPEPQAQDVRITNGAAEASTSSPPASPPPVVFPALSDLSTTAEQGKDASTTVASSSIVPLKKFSAVKINKRFMEQNSTAPGASQTLSSSPSSKIASTTTKSPPPPATSHPRLVTKLTKLPSSSTGTSPGWTRPSSTAPSLAPSPVSGGVSVAPPPAPAPVSHGPPQLPHVGKVIQPQPRGAIQTPSTSKSESANGSSKQAWRTVKQGGSTTGVGPPPGVQNEFPTAAEVAQAHLNGVQDKKQSTVVLTASSPATTEADTFRGVHLNPNAHHWDEMEEDNDDFLGGVIEFGDGRSYQIPPVDAPQTTQDPSLASAPAPEAATPDPQSPSAPTGINKEDRFSDDYDRSWPRSAALSSNIRPRVGPPPGASTSSNSSMSPQEASRVLFNERSNRREPWTSNNRNAPPDGRLGKDASLHNNVQLLQKHGHDRAREVRRDSSSQGTEDQRWERGRRASNATTTHSAISGGRDSSRESLRQLPPHLASIPKPSPSSHTHQLPHLPPPSGRHGSTREQWRPGRSPEQSPVISSPLDTSSHVAPSPTSSVVASSPQTAIPADLETARKAAMHTAAERARIRRQQDEEEREKERERARKKAGELKENVKVENSTTEELSATQETQREPTSPKSPTVPAPDRQSFIRPPLLGQSLRGPDNGPTSPITATRTQRDAQSANQPPSVSSTVSSWRSNAAPLPPVSPRRSSHSPVTPAVTFPSAFQVLGAQLLNPSNDESLEEVEFTDLGKFVGVEPNPDEAVSPRAVQHIDVSTEDDLPSPSHTRSDLDPTWRRKTSLAPVKEQPSVIANTLPDVVSESPASRETHTIPASPSVPTTSISMGSPARPPTDGSFPGHTLSVPSSLPSQRSPRAPSISAFDDTMSRIKGAMQTKPHRSAHHDRAAANSTAHSAEQPRFGRGVTQTPRSYPPRLPEPDEPFTTLTELHNDIQSGGQSSRVKLPSSSRAHEPLSERELAQLKRSILPLRWEVLSWDPPVEGMSVRDYSINGVLFQKPLPQKGHPRYHVSLPPSGSYLVRRSSPANPKVHLPAKPLANKTLASGGAFGRPRVADENSNWRRMLPSIPDQVESTAESTASSEGLVTRSGSSPPDTDKPSDVTPSVETETTVAVQLSTKSRAEPKMPAGASVAFYRESTSCPSVSFTVSSELEDARQPEMPILSLPIEEHALVLQPLGNPKGNEVDGTSTLPTAREKAESKSSDGSSDTPLTPPSSTGWTKSLVKESPVRKPDPEQLKLLWSQTSEKADVPVVNSLEGIADDLPSVPFSLQEVKSEDGETPPPTGSNGAGPSRMSLHDVTRAFQQVPPPPAGSIAGKASPQSPAVSTTSGPARHPPFPSHAQPVHSTVGGPAYQPYPSPMLSHSPAPTLLYPHPMAPNHMMGGSSPQYHQPMWIPMAHAAPGGQTPGPLRSPYPAHPAYLSYPSPGAYGASQPGPPPPGPPNGAQSRPRPAAHAGLSPNMSHSRAPAPMPMYHQGSPVLVHPQVMHVQPSYPGTMPAGRGVPMQASHPTPNAHAGGYTPATHSPYVRPPWHPPVN